VPLSSTFREQLLVAGDIPADILARFGGLTPSQERIEFAQARIGIARPAPAAEAPAQPVVAEPETPPVEVAATTQAEIPQEPASEPEPQLAENPEPQQAEQEIAAVAPAQTATREPAPAPERATEPELEPEPAPETVEVALAPPSAPPEEEAFEEEEEEEFLPFSVDSLLEQQLYHSSLFAHTFKNVRYPSRARRLNREGRVIVQVLVAPDGALVASELAETSGYKSLDKAALAAVKDSDPFPVPPAGLATVEEPFEFILPIEFKLQQ
jgi:TonB family protein